MAPDVPVIIAAPLVQVQTIEPRMFLDIMGWSEQFPSPSYFDTETLAREEIARRVGFLNSIDLTLSALGTDYPTAKAEEIRSRGAALLADIASNLSASNWQYCIGEQCWLFVLKVWDR